MRRALSASQFASSPSPSEVAMPMPVIQTSVSPGCEDVVSVMGDQFQRVADLAGHRIHVDAQGRVREGDVADGEIGAAFQLLADARLRRSDGKARAFVLDFRID